MFLIYYGRDGATATRMAAEARKAKQTCQVRHAEAFRGEAERATGIAFLNCVSEFDRNRIADAHRAIDAEIAIRSQDDWQPGPVEPTMQREPKGGKAKDETEPDDLDPVEEARRNAITIPDEWTGLAYHDKRALAHLITGEDLRKLAEVDQAIQAEVDRRAASI